MPMTHNMVSTVHLMTDRKKIDLNLIAGCMPNTVSLEMLCNLARLL